MNISHLDRVMIITIFLCSFRLHTQFPPPLSPDTGHFQRGNQTAGGGGVRITDCLPFFMLFSTVYGFRKFYHRRKSLIDSPLGFKS